MKFNNNKKQKSIEESKMLKNKKRRSLFFGTAILSLVFLMTIVGSLQTSRDPVYTFNTGTYINGEQVGGYTIEKASQVVTNRMKEQIQNINIQIIYKDKVWNFTEDDFEVENSVLKVVQTAYKKFNQQSLENKNAIKALSGGNVNISLQNTFKNFDNVIDNIVSEVNEQPENAQVIFNPNKKPMFEVTEGKTGVEVDRQKLVNDLENQFLKTKDIKVYVSTNGIKPQIEKTYFDNKLNLMSRFETDLTNSQEGRRHNVSFALKKFNGKIIKAGEKVSFNEISGPQTLEGGYKNAIVILNGKFTNGVGGGICQASTTMYNACLLANLQIDEVHKHTLPVGYVELSLDAMVSEGYADFIFTNTSADDIYIKSEVVGDKAIVEIYGNSIPQGQTIKRVAEFVGNIPHNGDKIIADQNGEYTDKVIYKGEYYRLNYPREGYEAKAFKEVYQDGKLISREQIRHEKYQPIDGKIIEGVKTPPEGYVIPPTDVEFIKPEKPKNEAVSTVVNNVKKNNPTQFNP